MIVCSVCGGSDIMQEASILLPANDPCIGDRKSEFLWNDFYWCNTCDDECHWDEAPEPKKIVCKNNLENDGNGFDTYQGP